MAPAPPGGGALKRRPGLGETPFLPITSNDMTSTEGLTYRIIVAPPAGPASAAAYPIIYIVVYRQW
jgi:hypothetical protein